MVLRRILHLCDIDVCYTLSECMPVKYDDIIMPISIQIDQERTLPPAP